MLINISHGDTFLLRIFMHPDMKIYFVFGYLAELHIFHLKPIFEVH